MSGWLRPRRLLAALAAGVLALGLGLAGRAITLPSRQVDPGPAAPLELDVDAAVEHLAAAIRLPTISPRELAERRDEPFRALHDLLIRAYPCVHRAARREVIDGLSLLYTWEGSAADEAPILLLAHQDVVPVEEAAAWTHPPFAGEVADGRIWGRGAIDDKAGLIALFEASEALCRGGFAPRRSVLIALGHDEERDGQGAQAIAAELRARGVRAAASVDEGMVITEGLFPGLEAPLATIGVAEKGIVTLEATVELADGHSSMPPPATAAGILAAALARIEADPSPTAIRPPVDAMLEAVAPELGFGRRLALANLWLTGPLVRRLLSRSDRTRALLHTTTAITVIQAGIKENVLPRRARALINFRIAPGDTIDGVLERTRALADDPRVELRIDPEAGVNEPSAVADHEGWAFAAIAGATRAVIGDAVVAPALVLGRTDSIQYADVVDQSYRFRPFLLSDEEIAAIHGSDERIRVDAFARGIRVSAEMIRRLAL